VIGPGAPGILCNGAGIDLPLRYSDLIGHRLRATLHCEIYCSATSEL
jgi:hypothetical protein